MIGQDQHCIGISCRPARKFIYLQRVVDHAQSFAVESTYTGLTVKARAGLGSAAWGELISAGPVSQPRCQHVLCIGLLGLVLQTKRSMLHNITMHKFKRFYCICRCDWSGSPMYRYLLQAGEEIHLPAPGSCSLTVFCSRFYIYWAYC